MIHAGGVRRISGFVQTLTFTYAVLPKAVQAEVEGVLIGTLGTAKLANVRRKGLYEDQFTD